jgi:hypothetical protein
VTAATTYLGVGLGGGLTFGPTARGAMVVGCLMWNTRGSLRIFSLP